MPLQFFLSGDEGGTVDLAFTRSIDSQTSRVRLASASANAVDGFLLSQPISEAHVVQSFLSEPTDFIDDVYSIRLDYRNASSNATAAVWVENVRLDQGIAQPPAIWDEPSEKTRYESQLPISFLLAEEPSLNGVRLTFTELSDESARSVILAPSMNVSSLLYLSAVNAPTGDGVIGFEGAPFVPGRYEVSFNYLDLLGNSLLNAPVKNITIDLGDKVTQAPTKIKADLKRVVVGESKHCPVEEPPGKKQQQATHNQSHPCAPELERKASDQSGEKHGCERPRPERYPA